MLRFFCDKRVELLVGVCIVNCKLVDGIDKYLFVRYVIKLLFFDIDYCVYCGCDIGN